MEMILYVVQTIRDKDWTDCTVMDSLDGSKNIVDSMRERFPTNDFRVVKRVVETREDDQVVYTAEGVAV